MSWRDVYYKRKALHEEWKAMFGPRPYNEEGLSDRARKEWNNRKAELEKEATQSAELTEAAAAYGAARAAGRIATAPIDIATDYAKHVMKKNYDRGFMEYRTKPYYVNYNIRPVWVRRRYTRPYRAYTRAYSLPFYYSRAGPAYQHNRRTRNFWGWHR